MRLRKWFVGCATALVMATVVLPIEAGNIVFVGDFDNDGGGDGSVLENAIGMRRCWIGCSTCSDTA